MRYCTRSKTFVKAVTTRIPLDCHAKLEALAARKRISVNDLLESWIVPRINAAKLKPTGNK